MNNHFQINGLQRSEFTHLLQGDESTLAQMQAQWQVVDAQPGYPCRISLEDAKIGERVLLCHFNHLQVASPYRACGPIFIREQAVQAIGAINHVPEMLLHRTLSLRAYNQQHMMLQAAVINGNETSSQLKDLFSKPDVSYVHIHNAGPGCFNCAVHRPV